MIHAMHINLFFKRDILGHSVELLPCETGCIAARMHHHSSSSFCTLMQAFRFWIPMVSGI